MIGIYVHLPFCRVHCTYCAFAISTDLTRETPYVDALIREIAHVPSPPAKTWPPRTPSPPAKTGGEGGRRPDEGAVSVDTLYFGGGTPSRTSHENVRRITSAIRETFDVSTTAEFSIEANPEDVHEQSLAEWKTLGVNRISIGVQSFADEELMPLGRVHSSRRAREAVATTIAAGFHTNLDLILGLPGQTPQSFIDTLETAMALGTGHVSLYMLDLEERSPLAAQVDRGRVTLPDESTVADLYIEAVSRLERGGLHQYEISNFARPGEECRHNIRYWTRGEYLGFGLGAHSFLGGRRFANTRDINQYIARSPDAQDFTESLGSDEERREILFLRLRQPGGIDSEQLARLCGQEGIEWMDRGLRDGWLRRDGDRIAFTTSGFLLSNDLIAELF